MTGTAGRGHAQGMKARGKEQQGVYDADKIRAAIQSLLDERDDLKVRPWAEKAGVSEGSLRAFLKARGDHAMAPQVDMFVKLAWAARVPVSRLLGEQERPANGDTIDPPPPLTAEQVVDVLRALLDTQRRVNQSQAEIDLLREKLETLLEAQRPKR